MTIHSFLGGRTATMLSRASVVAKVMRYLVVGAGTNCLSLAVYYGATFGLGLDPKLALMLGAGVAFGPAYAANRRWTFGADTPHASSLWRYSAGYLASFAFQAAFLALMVDGLGLPHEYVVLAGLLLATAFFYLLQGHWVFRRGTRERSGGDAGTV